MATSISRRKLLLRTVQFSFGGALVSAGAGGAAIAADKACVDLKAMDAGEQSTRMELHWAAASPDPKKICSLCGFFSATTAGCGNCLIFNGPTTEGGHCDSWSAKS